ncbi:MAG: UvrD-helicase domain-containing protein [Acidobacteriia bacterium]|nr:UvrD-helicase domain-containing protein [Terriglobia bacterium]
MDFTPRQLDAIDISKAGQDTCVVAGPGSGKTRVLVERYRRLVEAGCAPQRILAITFTEKAARNMKERLVDAFRTMPERRRELEQANISTVHGLCARLLRENSVAAGIDPEFRVLDARQATIMQRESANDVLDRMFADEPESMRRLMHGLASPELAREIPDVYDAMRSADVRAAELRGFAPRGATGFKELRDALAEVARQKPSGWNPSQSTRLREVVESAARLAALPDGPITVEHFRVIAEFPTNLRGLKQRNAIADHLMKIKDEIVPKLYRTLLTEYYASEHDTLIALVESFDQLYGERKRAIGVLDYSDLEAFAVRLLEENPEVRGRVRNQFQYVLMDELQDTNGQQSRLIELLRAPGVFFAVGDVNQSIYGFRHADPGVFRAYRDEVEREGKHSVELLENWRSRAGILCAVETVLHHAPGIEERRLIAAKKFSPKSEASVEVIAGIADTADAALDLEARWVARRILDVNGSLSLESGPAGYGDMAVLVRNSEVIPSFTRAFEKAGIPYLLNQGKGFFETREVVDLMNLLRAIDNPRDETSLAGVLRSPYAGVSDEALLRLKMTGNLGSALRRIAHTGTPFSDGDLLKLRRFHELLLRWREARDLAGFDRLLMRAIDETGCAPEPGSRAAANVEKFLAMAREASRRITLAEFVEELQMMRDADARDADAPPEDAVNAVRIMTVHAAKGLEFPVVFLAALHKGMQQGVGSLAFSPRIGLGAQWLNPATGERKRDWFLKHIEEEAKQRETEEGNRLFYVAMTRAEEHLVFSYSSFGKRKEWAAALEGAVGLDLGVPAQRVQPIQAPNGESFPLRVFASNQAPEFREPAEQKAAAAPIEVVARPAAGDQYDFAANVTSVALYAHCPRRYYLERYLGWRGNSPRKLQIAEEEDPGDEVDASQFGLEVHALLAGQPVEPASAEARKLVEAFHASELGRRAARASRIEREFDFVMAMENVVLRGQIDLWFEEGGELVLVDYKTDDIKARDAASRAQFYAPQLRLYARALERIAGRSPAKGFLYFLRPGVAWPVSLEQTLLDNPEELVRDFRDAQGTLDFSLHEGEHCTRCPYFRGLCPAGSGVSNVVHAPAVDGDDLAGDETGAG